MTLSSQTNVGLTFGQALALVSTILTNVGILFYAYMVINIRLNTLEENQKQTQKAYLENREDHNIMFVKIDKIYELEIDNKKGS